MLGHPFLKTIAEKGMQRKSLRKIFTRLITPECPR
jgi:hypothetical protein